MTFPETRELAPHDPPMLQVGEVVMCDDERIITRTIADEANLFHVPGWGLPAYLGFEIMAQSISVQDGLVRRETGAPPQIGFLLGCRKYSVTRDWFAPGDILLVEAVSLLSEGEMRSFDCTIRNESGEKLAHGVINVFRPEDPDAFLSQGERVQ